MRTQLEIEISRLWATSRTALAKTDCSRYSRMIYVKNELKRTYPKLVLGMSSKQIWFEIENQLNF